MSNARRCINKRFAVKNSGIYLLALIFNLSDPRFCRPRMTMLHAKYWFKVAKYDESYTILFE